MKKAHKRLKVFCVFSKLYLKTQGGLTQFISWHMRHKNVTVKVLHPNTIQNIIFLGISLKNAFTLKICIAYQIASAC